MRTIQRRDFLKAALTGAAALASKDTAAVALQGQPPARAQGADSRVEVLLNEPVGKISPEIYGHFVEHLGGVVYDGIWVGEDSKIPNVNGIRKELVDHMKRISPSVVRWPGGCFADSYNWRDGIGPRSSRPRRTNFWRDSRGRRAADSYAKLETGPQKVRAQLVRDQRIHAVLQADELSALLCRQPAQSACQRLLRMGGILQCSRRSHVALRSASGCR